MVRSRVWVIESEFLGLDMYISTDIVRFSQMGQVNLLEIRVLRGFYIIRQICERLFDLDWFFCVFFDFEFWSVFVVVVSFFFCLDLIIYTVFLKFLRGFCCEVFEEGYWNRLRMRQSCLVGVMKLSEVGMILFITVWINWIVRRAFVGSGGQGIDEKIGVVEI